MKYIPLLFLVIAPSLAFGQSGSGRSLTIKEIMQGPDFVGHLPSNISWSDDSKTIYFSWNPDKDTLESTYKVNINGGEISKLSFNELEWQTAEGDYNNDYSQKVYSRHGDLYLVELRTNQTRAITQTTERESDPTFSQDGQSIYFTQSDNLFQWSVATGAITQLTDFRKGKEASKDKPAYKEWLERDQLGYFDILEKRKNEKDAREYRQKEGSPKRPKPIYLDSKELIDLTISPDGRFVVYGLNAPAKEERTNVPDYVSQSGYTNDLGARPKVGTIKNNYETAIYDRERDTTYIVDTKMIPGIYDKPAFLRDYVEDAHSYVDTLDHARMVRIGTPVFSPSGRAVVNITAEDFKDRWIMTLDLPTGQLKLVDRQHDDAWIGGPGVGWFSPGQIEWIDDNTIWFQSEATGYSHLYTANVNTGKVTALTSGNWEVLQVDLSRDKKTFYLVTNESSPHEQHFYHMKAKGGKRTQITTLKGGHEVVISPDEQQLAIRFSQSNKPWELFAMANRPGAEMKQLTNSLTEAFQSYDWIVPEIVEFEARDGVKVPASIYEPSADRKNGAAVIFVHGAGYLQNVHSWWPGYYREYMFHHLLRDKGYTVLEIDFRASAGYGRDWRTAIYRHMGGKDLTDQVDGAQYLISEHGIDPDKIGIYGGSYGGFITLMAMFQHGDVFKSGAALRSVTDWAHYNHYYTANILNTPVEDSLAYRRSSPVYFAGGLQGNLLMLHGMIDRNVHFQDVVRLSQKLIELGKEDWELAVFPLEGHGFVEASSWADEYRRILELFDETLRE